MECQILVDQWMPQASQVVATWFVYSMKLLGYLCVWQAGLYMQWNRLVTCAFHRRLDFRVSMNTGRLEAKRHVNWFTALASLMADTWRYIEIFVDQINRGCFFQTWRTHLLYIKCFFLSVSLWTQAGWKLRDRHSDSWHLLYWWPTRGVSDISRSVVPQGSQLVATWLVYFLKLLGYLCVSSTSW